MTFSHEQGRMVGIAIKTRPSGPMKTLLSARVTPEGGIASELVNHAPGRKITLLSRETWRTVCAELDTVLPWTARRANLLVEGLSLEGARGRRLQIGDLILEITGETRPCGRMEDTLAGLRAALSLPWRGGATCRVIQGGQIAVGDPVRWVETASPPPTP